MNINSLQAAGIPVFNAQVPKEGPFAVSLTLDFSANQSYSLDLQQMTANGGTMTLVQTLFVDTTGLTGNINIVVGGGTQTLIMKPNTQGYYPVVCPNPPRFQFNNTGGTGAAHVIILNIPVSPAQWPTT